MIDSKDFPKLALARFSQTIKNILHPSFYEHTLREIGVSLGREVLSHVRRSHATAPLLQQQYYLQCLEWLKTHGGWNHELKVETKSRFEIFIPHCPFGKLGASDPALCQIEAGVLGGIAGDHFGYGKVEIFRGPDTPPKGCSLTVHLERTAQSMIAEGPSFPLAPSVEKLPHTVGPEAEAFAYLSSRERQIVKLIGEGLSDKEIAKILRLSVRTVEGHAARIRDKTGLRTRRALIRFAFRMDTTFL